MALWFTIDLSIDLLNNGLMNDASSRLRAVRSQIFEKLGTLALALGSAVRLRLIQVLAQGPHTVEELSEAIEESVANTSQHLQRLARVGVVQIRKDGVRRVYSISDPRVLQIWESLQDLAHVLFSDLALAESEISDLDLRSPISANQVLEQVQSRRAVLLDVREERDFQATPVAGATWLAIEDLKTRSDSLPKSRPVFVFCRGRYCSMATEAVKLLRAKGFEAFRLRESSFALNQLSASEAATPKRSKNK